MLRAVLTSVVALTLAGTALAAPPSVDSLAWLAGAWEGTDEAGVEMEEVWLAPKGGSMLGTHRDVKGGRTQFFEFFRIATETDGRVVYWASPAGRTAVPFALAETGEKRVVFTNTDHDFPQRILYWTDEKDRLHARVEGTGGRSIEWTWQKSRR